MMVDGSLKMTFHPMSPVVSAETNKAFADAFMNLLQVIPKKQPQGVVEATGETMAILRNIAMPISAAVAGTLAIASHAGAYADFSQYVMEMKQNADSSEFWPALNFWIFFAVGHPILQPILWISDVLHVPERRLQGCFRMEQVPNRCIQWHAVQWEHLTLITTGKLCGVQLGLTSFWNCSRNPLRMVGDKQCNNTKNMPKGHLHVNSLLRHASHWSQTIDMHQLKTIMRIIILHHAGHCPFLSLDKYFQHALKVM